MAYATGNTTPPEEKTKRKPTKFSTSTSQNFDITVYDGKDKEIWTKFINNALSTDPLIVAFEIPTVSKMDLEERMSDYLDKGTAFGCFKQSKDQKKLLAVEILTEIQREDFGETTDEEPETNEDEDPLEKYLRATDFGNHFKRNSYFDEEDSFLVSTGVIMQKYDRDIEAAMIRRRLELTCSLKKPDVTAFVYNDTSKHTHNYCLYLAKASPGSLISVVPQEISSVQITFYTLRSRFCDKELLDQDKGAERKYMASSSRKRARPNAEQANDLAVAIMLEPFFDLTEDQWKAIEGKMLEAYDETVFTEDPRIKTPIFRSKTFLSDGVIKMWCEDDDAVKWLRQTVAKIPSPRPDAVLVVRPQRKVPRRVRAVVHLLHNDTVDRIRVRLHEANKRFDVNAKYWTYYKADPQLGGGVRLELGIPEREANILKRKGRGLHYMSGCVPVTFMDESAESPTSGTPNSAGAQREASS